MIDPHRARRLALQGLCSLDVQGAAALDLIYDFIDASEELPEICEAARMVLRDAWDNRAECDKLLTRHAKHWNLDRLALVDRNILRLAVTEMLALKTDPKAVIAEALLLAREFSTAESPRFVNGVLDAVAREIILPVQPASSTVSSAKSSFLPVILNPMQVRAAIEAMWDYLKDPKGANRHNPAGVQAARVKTIEQEAKPLVTDYIAGNIPLEVFKSGIDGIGRRKLPSEDIRLWKFDGPGGQMFFNMLVNVVKDQSEFNRELRLAITIPVGDEDARRRIETFADFIEQLGEKRGRSPFFLSFFWQIQDRDVWPIYFDASVKQMTSLKLWEMPKELGERYIVFKRIQEELAKAFTEESGEKFGIYDVEGVFWFRKNHPRPIS